MTSLPADVEQYIDDSEFENVDGRLRKRPVPGKLHAALQHYLVDALKHFERAKSGFIASEWSLSDGQGHWLTPDVMLVNNGYRETRRGHLWAPPSPHLVIEIRSIDQPIRDLFDKAKDYRTYQVPFYWIVDPVEDAFYEVLVDGSERIRNVKDRLNADDVFLTLEDLLKFPG